MPDYLVALNPELIAAAGDDKEIVQGTSTLIGGNPIAKGGTESYSYSWTPTTGLDNPIIANPTASPNETTTYTLTVTDGNECEDTDEVTVIVNKGPAIASVTENTNGETQTINDVITVTVTQADDGITAIEGKFRIGDTIIDKPLTETSARVWSGTYTVVKGDMLDQQPVIATLKSDKAVWTKQPVASETKISIDTAAPETTATPSGTEGENDWYTSKVTVTLSASDANSGVSLTKYRIDNGEWKTYESPFDITTDGTHTVDYYSVDEAGNKESTKSEIIKIDTTPPTTFELKSPEHDRWEKSDGLTFTWNASSDATSDLAKYQLYINENVNQDDIPPDQTSIGAASTLLEAAYLWKVVAFDVAGNTKESTSTFKVKVDNQPPGEFDLVSPNNGVWLNTTKPMITTAASWSQTTTLAALLSTPSK